MPRKPLIIEDLLEHMGTLELSGDSTHRYELRRKLLCSRFFHEDFQKTTRWDRVFTYTAPLIAGGMMVGVFALFALSPVEEETVASSTVLLQTQVAEPEAETVASVSPHQEFLSDPSEPKLRFVDFGQEEPENFSAFIPLNYAQYVRTQ